MPATPAPPRRRAKSSPTPTPTAWPIADWLYYLIGTLVSGDYAGVGGPNVSPPAQNWVQACVAAAPGGPSHVLLTDTVAEHIPGCNMAFYRWAFENVGGFDPEYHKAGDDVDFCWRLQQAGGVIAFQPDRHRLASSAFHPARVSQTTGRLRRSRIDARASSISFSSGQPARRNGADKFTARRASVGSSTGRSFITEFSAKDFSNRSIPRRNRKSRLISAASNGSR